jgi:hypothetical protein
MTIRLQPETDPVTSIPELTRLLAAIHTWQDEHGLDAARKLLDEVANMLVEIRRELLGRR